MENNIQESINKAISDKLLEVAKRILEKIPGWTDEVAEWTEQPIEVLEKYVKDREEEKEQIDIACRCLDKNKMDLHYTLEKVSEETGLPLEIVIKAQTKRCQSHYNFLYSVYTGDEKDISDEENQEINKNIAEELLDKFYELEIVEKVTGLPTETIREIAEKLVEVYFQYERK